VKLLSLLLALTLSLHHGALPGPPPSPHALQQPPFQISVDVNLVNVDVTVADARGAFVSNLTRDQFRLLDDGVPQPITHFEAVETPAQVLVLVEAGPAVALLHREHLNALHALLEGLAPDDQVALASYDQSPRLALPFTADKSALAQAMGSPNFFLGMAQLNLYESLSTVLDWLRSVPGKKAVVLLSTGIDTSKPGSWAALEQKLAAGNVVIFPVALSGELRAPPKKKPANSQAAEEVAAGFAEADRALNALAEESGGQAYFPQNAKEFPVLYARIASLLRHQYSLGFAAPARDARYHRIELQVLDAAGHPAVGKDAKPLFRVSHRRGYLAPAP
jgi:VWFA-related protein